RIMDPDSVEIAPCGYTIEIMSRCFDKYSEEELGALILHDMLQNVLSDTAKLRFIKAWTALADRKGDRYMNDMLDLATFDKVAYLVMMQICITPFRVPINNFNYVAADDVLKAVGLADAYESYLGKVLQVTNTSVEDIMDDQVEEDRRTMALMFDVCKEGQEDGYLKYVHDAFPLISMERAMHMNFKATLASSYGRHPGLEDRLGGVPRHVMDESYNNPSSDYDIQYSVDKIVNAMRYAESESERDVVLFRIKQLSLKIIKLREKLEKSKTPSATIAQRIMFLQEKQVELEELRKKCLAMEIKEKRWSVYVKDQMPEGYDM
ncbi:MAG: hypothetical protein K2F99_03580, partial [Muribaculaceae bacterium]|nr:hypothetical protein [Muribaculaceae bacterium]